MRRRSIFARVRQTLGAVSAERVISGRGLERLYVAMNVGIAPLPAREIVPLAKRGDAAAHQRRRDVRALARALCG